MGKVILLTVGGLSAASVLTFLYLTIRHWHRRWRWEDKVNENNLRKAVLDEFKVEYHVDEAGRIRPVQGYERRREN